MGGRNHPKHKRGEGHKDSERSASIEKPKDQPSTQRDKNREEKDASVNMPKPKRGKKPESKSKIPLISLIVAILVLGVYWLQLQNMREVNRPVVGISSIHNTPGFGGTIDFVIRIQNFGPVQADQVGVECHIFHGKTEMPVTTEGPPAKVPIPPGKYYDVCLERNAPRNSGLQIFLVLSWKGPGGAYKTCSKAHYSDTWGQVDPSGTCDPDKPFPQ